MNLEVRVLVTFYHPYAQIGGGAFRRFLGIKEVCARSGLLNRLKTIDYVAQKDLEMIFNIMGGCYQKQLIYNEHRKVTWIKCYCFNSYP